MLLYKKSIIKDNDKYAIQMTDNFKGDTVIKLYKVKDINLFKIFKVSIWEKVYSEKHRTIRTNILCHEDYFINTTEDVIKHYEQQNKKDKNFEQDLKNAINKFNNWEGIIK